MHARGPATAKARSPIVVRRVTRTIRADEDVDRRRRREVTATGWITSCIGSAAPYREDSCEQERTTCRLCVQVHVASVGLSATA